MNNDESILNNNSNSKIIIKILNIIFTTPLICKKLIFLIINNKYITYINRNQLTLIDTNITFSQ